MLNKIILQGRLTANPELRHTQGGVATSTFRLACERDFADRNGSRQADFISVVAWRQAAEFVCRYFTKGSMILVEGRIQTRDYTDSSGSRRYVTEVIAECVHFAASRREGGSRESSSQQAETAQQPPAPQYSYQQTELTELDTDDGELPF